MRSPQELPQRPIEIASVEIGPLQMFVHHERDLHISFMLAKKGIWEPLQTRLVLRLVLNGQTVVDVGANIGYYTLMMSRLVGPRGKILAFEPEPSNFELLRKNIKLNRIGNVVLERKAVAHRDFRADLYLSAENMGDHRLFDARSGRPSCRVDAVALDGHPALEEGPVHFVKVDTQGAEPSVIDGMTGIIERNRQVLSLLIEFSPGLLARSGFGVDGLLRRLLHLDASMFWLAEGGSGARLVPVTPMDLRGIAVAMERTGEEDCSRDILVCFSRTHAGVGRLSAMSW